MVIRRFRAEGFRNLRQTEMEPCPGINVLYGENGQGKTNCVEAIWMFTGCRSFRTGNLGELIRHGEAKASLRTEFVSNAREQTAALALGTGGEQNRAGEATGTAGILGAMGSKGRNGKRRELILNGMAQDTPRRMLGVFPAVVFSPAALAMIQGGPGERRRFLDVAVSMLRPAYAVTLSKYIKALAQRNALLRKYGKAGRAERTQDGTELFEAWEEELAKQAAGITLARRQYLRELAPRAEELYGGVSGGREAMGISIQGGGPDEENRTALEEAYAAQYRTSRAGDLHRQLTSVGPHREDLLLTLDGQPVRAYGSQGQQRSAALALKLAEADVIRALSAECPAALLDDVLSELDGRRQTDLLRCLREWQIFLTCCEPSHLLHGKVGKAFLVAGGEIREAKG
ncbi:MAG: DNA replication and repair protein RecF [Oscillospiraceae bacterium]|nr:DNA replication and repair protein RecF [Oscillospiraceae bacterium]